MSFIATLTALVTAMTAAVLGLFGLNPAPVAPIAPETVELVEQASDEVVAAYATSTEAREAYDLGKAVGKLQGTLETLQKIPTTTPPTQAPAIPPVVQSPQPVPTPMPEPTPAPTPAPAPEPVSLARGEISIISKSGVTYKANDYQVNPDGTLKSGTEPTEENSVQLAFVLFKDDGKAVEKDVTVTVTADTSTPITIQGTGNFLAKLNEGKGAHYYPFNYEFRNAGPHTITFSSGNVSKSITLNAQ